MHLILQLIFPPIHAISPRSQNYAAKLDWILSPKFQSPFWTISPSDPFYAVTIFPDGVSLLLPMWFIEIQIARRRERDEILTELSWVTKLAKTRQKNPVRNCLPNGLKYDCADDVISINNNTAHCLLCGKDFKADKGCLIKQHVDGDKHKNEVKKKSEQSYAFESGLKAHQVVKTSRKISCTNKAPHFCSSNTNGSEPNNMRVIKHNLKFFYPSLATDEDVDEDD